LYPSPLPPPNELPCETSTSNHQAIISALPLYALSNRIIRDHFWGGSRTCRRSWTPSLTGSASFGCVRMSGGFNPKAWPGSIPGIASFERAKWAITRRCSAPSSEHVSTWRWWTRSDLMRRHRSCRDWRREHVTLHPKP